MHRIAAAPLLALLLMAGQYALAQTATVINLSCDGTVQSQARDPEPVRNIGLVVNLAQNTVVGFVPTAHIDRIDQAQIDFSVQAGAPLGGSSILGSINRVTGAAYAFAALVTKDGKVKTMDKYELVCKVTNRLF